MPQRSRLILSALALATVVLGYLDWRAEHQRRVDRAPLLIESGLIESAPKLVRLLNSDPDSVAADNRLALALIAEVLDPNTRKTASSESSARALLQSQIDRLDRAEQIGNTSLAVRPNAWRALTAVGAAIYLRHSFYRDPKLIRDYRDWEAPLEAARALAPDRNEPTRFLTMAYLEIWPMLSPEKQQLTRSMLATGLVDPTVFHLTIDPWLQVAGGSLDSINLLPQTAWVFNDLRKRFVRRGNLELAAESQRRYRTYVHKEASASITKAQQESDLGDFLTARKTLFAAMATLPIDQQFEPIFDAIVRALPAGPIAVHAQGAVHLWLDYNSQQCLRRPCPLKTDLVERLLPAAGTAVRTMRTHLALGNIAAASEKELALTERCSRAARGYWLQKSKFQLEHADPSGARQSLLTCSSSKNPGIHPPLLYDRLFQAVRPGSDAARALAVFSTTSAQRIGPPTVGLNATEFHLPAGNYELELLPASVSGSYGLFEVLLDGALIATFVLQPNPAPQVLAIAATGSPQILNFRSVASAPRTFTVIEVRALSSSH